jgi:hypothetical protein
MIWLMDIGAPDLCPSKPWPVMNGSTRSFTFKDPGSKSVDDEGHRDVEVEGIRIALKLVPCSGCGGSGSGGGELRQGDGCY